VGIRVEIEGETPELKRLQRLARFVLAAEGIASGEVGVVLTDNSGIQALNRQYLGHDYPTDVLAFSMQEPVGGPAGFVLPEEAAPNYIGDVAVSLARAREQAATYGHDWTREVEILLIHGLLHLLDYDDSTAAAQARMEARQESLLQFFAHPHSMVDTFHAAFQGLFNLFWTQRNIYAHLAIVAVVVTLAAVLRVSWTDWLFLILAMALVLVTETMNTAVEALVDLISPGRRPLAGRAKDLAAAAVLLAAFFAVVMGGLVFGPYLWRLLFGK
jgi:rRNA maturation RNase YbeY